MDKRLIVPIIILIFVFWLHQGGYLKNTLWLTVGLNELKPSSVQMINESCVRIDFYSTGPFIDYLPSPFEVTMVKEKPPQYYCDEEYLECWGISKDFISKINTGWIEGEFKCWTQCPYPQESAKFEDFDQEFIELGIEHGYVKKEIGVRVYAECPEPYYCGRGTKGWSATGSMYLCHFEAPIIECYTDQDCIDKYKNCDYYCEDGRCIAKTVTHPPKTCPDGSIVKWIGYPTCDYEECPEIPEEEEVQPTPTPQPINWRATIIGIVVIALAVILMLAVIKQVI